MSKIQLKKFNTLKFQKINKLLGNIRLINNISSFFIKLNYSNNISNEKIKESNDFIIIKENYTNSYFMTLKDLIVIHINKKNKEILKQFEMEYSNSNEFMFLIYETYHYYHFFCISHKISDTMSYETEHILFTLNNLNDNKYALLSSFYDSFIIINKGINSCQIIKSFSDELLKNNDTSYLYKFIGELGYGNKNFNIENTIIKIIKIANEHLKFLPYNYLLL